MNGERADDGGGELITNLKNTAIYYDLVNFQMMILGYRDLTAMERGRSNFLFFFFCMKYSTGLYSGVNQG